MGEQVRSLMTVFETSGIVSSTGGVVRLRKVSDLRSTLEGTNLAFDRAIEDAHNKESPQISSENRRLMEDILKRSQDNQDQMSSRVTALLAGSSLTTTAGVRIDRRDTIDQIDYTAVGDDLSKLKESYKPRRRKAQSEMRAPTSLHQANSAELRIGVLTLESAYSVAASNACLWPGYAKVQNSVVSGTLVPTGVYPKTPRPTGSLRFPKRIIAGSKASERPRCL